MGPINQQTNTLFMFQFKWGLQYLLYDHYGVDYMKLSTLEKIHSALFVNQDFSALKEYYLTH